MLYTDEDLFEAARTIRGELPDLLTPETAKSLDDRLAELLNQVPFDLRDLHYETISAIATKLETLLKAYEPTGTWLDTFLERLSSGDRKSFEPLAGDRLTPIPIERYTCPHRDFYWSRLSPAEAIPLCPTHHLPLVPRDRPATTR